MCRKGCRASWTSMKDEPEGQQQQPEVTIDFYKKLVAVGDGGCGKTSLISSYITGVFPEQVRATVFDTVITEVTVGKKKVRLSLCDTAGQETYDTLRTRSYDDTDVVIIVFSVDAPESLDNVEVRWRPEVKHFSPDVPILLVGNKTDLRNDPETIEVLRERRQSPVSYQEGLAVAKKIKAKAYMECSAKDGAGVVEVIQKACRLAIGRKKPNLFLRLFCKSCT
ncbi:hypothetical protein HPB51_024342 [Rhipicephalus microplus]|uniref:Rho n=1 Tax=Rhipicephalus microplus TaxID=6941 RepID=A0A9J6EE55_RHIMP|nr:hypothetical protein HPB51_024342 [Rhipicephalus microplus]